jgi:CRISPR-associated protein Cas1
LRNPWDLKPEARKTFYAKFEERLLEEIQHPHFGYRTSYRRCIELQARLLAKKLTSEIPEYLPFVVR